MALPVFHPGYFGHTLAVLQVVCKECSRVLLPEAECEKRLARARQHGAPPMKALKEECRKMKTCVHCGAYNGTVKKGTEGLKIVHAKSFIQLS